MISEDDALLRIVTEIADAPERADRLIMLRTDPRYDAAVRAWDAVLAARPADLGALRAAGRFFWLPDPARAAQLFARGEALDPTDSEWSRDRALAAHRAAGPADALPIYERALATCTQHRCHDEHDRRQLLVTIAQLALELGQLERAERAALQLVADDQPRDYECHLGFAVLGRIAIVDNDLPLARSYLDAAAMRDCELDEPYPDFALASELLARGERAAVRSYLVELLRWCTDTRRITEHLAALDRGEVPDFSGD